MLERLRSDESGVSPVVGVILMVAITVMLAAVVAGFVLQMEGELTTTSPDASFAFQYDSDANEVTITHDAGEPIAAGDLVIRGKELTNGPDIPWPAADADSDSLVRAGYSTTVAVDSNGYEINVVYESGSSTRTLQTAKGPAA